MAAEKGMKVQKGMVLKGKWTLTNYLARGACAEIWSVRCDDKTTKNEKRDQDNGWVAKLVPEPPFMTAAQKKKVRKATDIQLNAKTLAWEHTLYHSILRGHDSVPKTPIRDDFGTQDDIRFLIMQRLGPNIEEYFNSNGRSISNTKLAHYGRQMLSALRQCHERKLLFVDVKPENFMLDYVDQDKLYIADFGVADKYVDSKGQHRPEGGESGSGTPAYMSLRCHAKGTASRRDDIEALAYVLIELLVGELPWSKAKSEKELYDSKKSTDISVLCSSGGAAGVHLSKFCEIARSMGFTEDPDYGALDALIVAVSKCAGSGAKVGNKAKMSSSSSKAKATSSPVGKQKEVSETMKKSEAKEKVTSKRTKPVEKKEATTSRAKGALKKPVPEVVEINDDVDDEIVEINDDEEEVEMAVAKKSKKGVTTASASATRTVTYTYTAPRRRSKRNSKGGDSDSDEEPVTYTATATYTATKTASHPVASPVSPEVAKQKRSKK